MLIVLCLGGHWRQRLDVPQKKLKLSNNFLSENLEPYRPKTSENPKA